MPDYAKGADVSKWQRFSATSDGIDFQKMHLAPLDFVFIKASQGLRQDRDFFLNRERAKQAGIPRGFYHFADYKINPETQASFFWDLVKDDPGELPLVADFERNPEFTPNRAAAEQWLRGFVTSLEALSGKTPMIYTGAFFWKDYSSQDSWWNRFPLWIASYTTQEYMESNVEKLTPWVKWTFWQYTDKGSGEKYGVESKQIDLNYFHGTKEDLLARYGAVPKDEDDIHEFVTDLQQRFDSLIQSLDDSLNTLNTLSNEYDKLTKEMLDILNQHGE